jgi:glycosyltransferase involved in cell wall biosynthesis
MDSAPGMRIALGAHLLSGHAGYRQAGIHHYIKHLLAALPEAARQAGQPAQFTAHIGPAARDQVPPRVGACVAPYDTESPARRIRFEQTQLARSIGEANLFHGMAFALPLALHTPAVVTMFDLSFITQPHTHKAVNRAYLRVISALSCRKARRVIAISQHTADDTARLLGVPAGKIDAIALGAGPEFTPLAADARAAFRAAHNIAPRSVFYLGSIEPRKNLDRLIEAFVQLDARAPAQLLIGGGLGWKYDALLARIDALGMRARIRLLGRIPEADLPHWYAACDVFCYPSLYEGFGLPALEAMACGAVVVASNVTSLPEVIGDAGLMVNPTDTGALADALARALDDEALRATLSAKARARAAGMTWARTAGRTFESYQRALSAR